MNERKAKALELMLTGNYTITDIAEIVGCNRHTIYKWMKQPEFADAKAKNEEKLVSNLYMLALDNMEDILLNSKDEYKKISIFQQLCKIKGSNDLNVNVKSTPQTVEDILKDLGM